MAIDVTELVYPSGLIRPDLLPGDVLIRGPTSDPPRVVEVWLTAAQGLATGKDDAQRAYVYGRYYRAVADRLASDYSSHTEGRVTRQRSSAQIEHFSKLADTQDALYISLMASAETPTQAAQPSSAHRIRRLW